MPIYLVKGPGENQRLVNAGAKSTAINHVIRDTITAEPVSATELAEWLETGLKIEKATAPDNEPPTQ